MQRVGEHLWKKENLYFAANNRGKMNEVILDAERW